MYCSELYANAYRTVIHNSQMVETAWWLSKDEWRGRHWGAKCCASNCHLALTASHIRDYLVVSPTSASVFIWKAMWHREGHTHAQSGGRDPNHWFNLTVATIAAWARPTARPNKFILVFSTEDRRQCKGTIFCCLQLPGALERGWIGRAGHRN